MDIDRLSKSPVGSLIEISGFDSRFNEDYRTQSFLPDSLPDALVLGPRQPIAASQRRRPGWPADQAVRQLPNPALVVRPTIRREAVDTSALEGTFAAFTDVLEADFLAEE